MTHEAVEVSICLHIFVILRFSSDHDEDVGIRMRSIEQFAVDYGYNGSMGSDSFLTSGSL